MAETSKPSSSSTKEKALAKGIWWDFSSSSWPANTASTNSTLKPSCQHKKREGGNSNNAGGGSGSGGGGEPCGCREMSRSSTSPSLITKTRPSSSPEQVSSGSVPANVVVGVCGMNSKVSLSYV